MAVTKETVESRIQEIAKSCVHANVLEGKEAFELYNAIVGTTFDAESYNKIATEAPEYLMDHIPGGAKLIKEGEQVEESTTEQEKTSGTTPAEPDAEPEVKSEAEPEAEPKAEPKAEPVVESEPETTTVPVVTSEEVEAHKGEAVTEENEKFDIDKDGDIDNDDVAKSSEIEVV